MHRNIAPDLLLQHRDTIMDFKRFTEEVSLLHRLNETVLCQLFRQLEETTSVFDTLYWLSLARIMELAIQCAAHYVKNCEFALVGDLLVNPRRVMVHVKGEHQPFLKKRHTPLTEQFGHVAASKGGVVQWLKQQTIVEVRTNPLLRDLFERLKRSGMVEAHHLKSIDDRLKGVADFCAYLACGNFKNRADFETWLKSTGSEDRNTIGRKIRCFDYNLFDPLGEDIDRVAFDPDFKSRFLN